MPRLNKKAAIDLSISFIVIIIISLVVFAGSMLIVRKIFFGAEEIKTMLDEQTEEEIRGLLSSGETIAVPLAYKTIQAGKQDIFWVGIANVPIELVPPASKNFYLVVSFATAYLSTGATPPTDSPLKFANKEHINPNWLLYNPGPYTIAINDFEPASVMVKVGSLISGGTNPVNTAKGLYTFNVCVFEDSVKGDCGAEWLSLPGSFELLYTKHPKQFTVEVR
jgi:hypothetical protein